MKKTLAVALTTTVIFGNSFISAFAGQFSDVPDTHEYANEINYLYENSLAGGFSDGNFHPEQSITRAEFTKIVINASFDANEIDNCLDDHGYYGDIDVPVFPDVHTPHIFAKYICMAKEHEVVSGFSSGMFMPEENITYGQSAKVAIRSLDGSHGISETSDIWSYIDYLQGKDARPSTVDEGNNDHIVNRGEVAHIIQRLHSGYEALPNEEVVSSWQSPPENSLVLGVNYFVVLETNYGDIKIDLFETEAPRTTNNFIFLAKNNYYDGLTFHRVIEGFMIQGGDPAGNGTGGPGYEFEDEFVTSLSNVEGTISMANAGPNTNGSQFFINTVDNSFLDFDNEPTSSGHAVFGRVDEGMDIVEKIEGVEVGYMDKPIDDVVINNVVVIENLD